MCKWFSICLVITVMYKRHTNTYITSHIEYHNIIRVDLQLRYFMYHFPIFLTSLNLICLAVALTCDLNIGSIHYNSKSPVNNAIPKNFPNLVINYAPHAPNCKSNQSYILLSFPTFSLSTILSLFNLIITSLNAPFYKYSIFPKHNTYFSFFNSQILSFSILLLSFYSPFKSSYIYISLLITSKFFIYHYLKFSFHLFFSICWLISAPKYFDLSSSPIILSFHLHQGDSLRVVAMVFPSLARVGRY